MSLEDARRELHDLALRYARATDRRDYAAFADLFLPDGTLSGTLGDDSTPLYQLDGIEKIQRAMTRLEEYARTFHLVGNQLVDFEDDGESASAETYCQAHHIYRDDGGEWMNMTMFIRYQDRFAQTAQGWRFASRALVIDFRRVAPLGEAPPYE